MPRAALYFASKAVGICVCGVLLLLTSFATSSPTPAAASGPWSVVSTAQPPGESNALLGQVSCSGVSFCLAVGSTEPFPSGVPQGIAETWNGSTWSYVQDPPSVLEGVSCVAGNWCMAVGGEQQGPSAADIWNGQQWDVTNSLGISGAFEGVSCTSAAFCLAVGNSGTGTSISATWNGTTWTPLSSSLAGQFTSVSCVAASWCMAVGLNGDAQTLAASWSGSVWTTTGSVNPGPNANELSGVSCVSTTWCVSTGVWLVGLTDYSLYEQWNGSSSSLMQGSEVENSSLAGVSCTSTTACTAAADVVEGSSASIVQWDGGAWSALTIPNPTSYTPLDLCGVSCVGEQ